MDYIFYYIFIDIGTLLFIIGLVGFIYWDYYNRRKKLRQRKGKKWTEADSRYENFSLTILKLIGIFFLFLFFLFIRARFVDYVDFFRGKNPVNVMECVPQNLDNYGFICNNVELRTIYAASDNKASIAKAYNSKRKIKVTYFRHSKYVLSVSFVENSLNKNNLSQNIKDVKSKSETSFSTPEDYKIVLKKLEYDYHLYIIFRLIFLIVLFLAAVGYIGKSRRRRNKESFLAKILSFIFLLVFFVLLVKIFQTIQNRDWVIKRLEREGNAAIVNYKCTLYSLKEINIYIEAPASVWKFYCTESPNTYFYNMYLGFPTTAYYYNDIKDCVGQTVYLTQIKGTRIVYSIRGGCVNKNQR